MALWSLTDRPTWAPNAIQTARGWEDPVTGEILVAIGKLPAKRRSNLDSTLDNLLLEDGNLFLLEQDLSTDQAPDYLTLE